MTIKIFKHMKRFFSNKKINISTLLLSLASLQMNAQDKAPTAKTFWDEGALMLMLMSIIILMIVIVFLGKILKSFIETDTNEIWKKIKENKKIGMVILFFFISNNLMAQEEVKAVVAKSTGLTFGMDTTLFWVMFVVLLFEFLVLMVMSFVLYKFLLRKGLVSPILMKIPKWLQFQSMMGNDIPLEKDAELLTDHDYDGIQELDNGMPPFLKYIFIVTIVAAVAYWVNYHVIKTSPLMIEEYQIELDKAAIAKEEYLKKAGNLVDENTVVLTADAGAIANGEKLYIQNCVACHGDKGQGGVGPNFTDDYWLHGGDIKHVFKTIKYGVPDKGMRAWQSEIKPADMQSISSYILTKIAHTNVAGGKAPQGDLWKDTDAGAVTAPSDSTTTSTSDSTKTK